MGQQSYGASVKAALTCANARGVPLSPASEPDWAANDPLRFFPELRGVPTGVWCGDRDAFAEPARRYIAAARPEIGVIGPGRHDGVFYARVLPDAIIDRRKQLFRQYDIDSATRFRALLQTEEVAE